MAAEWQALTGLPFVFAVWAVRDKLHDLEAALDRHEVYSPVQVDDLVALYLGGADRDRLDPVLDACVAD